MKRDIHPDYMDCTVRCSCGNEFTTRSTKPELRIDICNVCHPFYTGTQKLIDTGGRVQRFADRFGSASEAVAEREAARKAERAAKAKEKEERAAKYAEEAASKAEAAEAQAEDASAEAVAAEAEAVVEAEAAEGAEEVTE